MADSSIQFLIISGTSGSGKSIALQVLEDLGYYCMDNLPASLLPDVARRASQKIEHNDNSQFHHYAVSIDSRNRDIIGDLHSTFTELDKLDIPYRIIFLDADDSVLLKRYSETRRKHPLSDINTSLSEAITRERQLIEHLADIADFRVNTTRTTPHELRSNIRNYAAASEQQSMTLLFQSFGFKYGNPREADFVFDVRCLPNPHWDPELKPLTGLDKPVQDFLLASQEAQVMYDQIRDFIDYWLPSFIKDNRNYITVAIGCTGGQHRSVFLGDRLHQHFSQNELIQTQLRHRELNG